mmetsp:Transcript_2104/g.3729  ORF Transcript_2104/g.3729 Transcript_2104/m.3729 type:complete len:202 (+) Transcript_2104:36-641(+)
MKSLIPLALTVATCSAFLAPTKPANEGRSSSTSTLQAFDDLYGMVGSLEGPSIAWGYEGPRVGKEETEIKGYDNFDQFLSALDQSDLKKTLRGLGPYTLLAPTNLACSTFQGYMDEEILKYHIILGAHASDSFSGGGDLKTLNGESLTYTRKYRKDFLDDAIIGMIGEIGQTPYPKNVVCENGIIHAIDRVLVPGYDGTQS